MADGGAEYAEKMLGICGGTLVKLGRPEFPLCARRTAKPKIDSPAARSLIMPCPLTVSSQHLGMGTVQMPKMLDFHRGSSRGKFAKRYL